jgi:hypothetical protein
MKPLKPHVRPIICMLSTREERYMVHACTTYILAFLEINKPKKLLFVTPRGGSMLVWGEVQLSIEEMEGHLKTQP